MQFGQTRVNPNLWKGSGTVTGIHTYNNAIKINDHPIQRGADASNTVEFDNEGVVIAKNLRVLGQLITPGFPPQGDGTPLPPNPTFQTVTATEMITSTNVNISEQLFSHNIVTAKDLTAGERLLFNEGGTIGTNSQVNMQIDAEGVQLTGNWNFSGAVVSGIDFPGASYPSIQETADRINITKRVHLSTIGNDTLHTSYNESATSKEIIFQNDDRAMFQLIYDVNSNKYQTIDWSDESIFTNIKASHVHPLNDSLSFYGNIDFSQAHIQGFDSYPSITETDNKIVLTKPLSLNATETNVVETNMLAPHNAPQITVNGAIDFSGATVTGLPGGGGGGYPSITEESDRISFEKRIDVGITSVVTPYIGTDDAGIELEEGAKRINMMLDNRNMVWSILLNSADGTTTTIDYSQLSFTNHMQCHTLSPRPGYNKIELQGILDFGDATVEGLYPGLGANPETNRVTIDAGTSLYFKDSMANHDVATEITDKKVYTAKVGRNNNEWYFTTYGEHNKPLAEYMVTGHTVMALSDLNVVMTVPIVAPKSGSSGNFTHCHLTEGAQNTTWEIGRVVTSTGEYCARDDLGNLIPNPTAAPDSTYAMCKVKYSTKGDQPLGIIASVENVAANKVNHEHGGLTLRANIQENDGYKMLRVAGSGDVMAWVVRPLLTQIDLPPLSGLWQKCVDNTGYEGGHTVLSNHVAVEADGYLSIDNQIIDTSTATVQIASDNIRVYPTAPTLTPNLFSGVYNKTINGIAQPIQIVMHCNQDYSFSFSEHFPSFEQRVAALEATIAELTGPE